MALTIQPNIVNGVSSSGGVSRELKPDESVSIMNADGNPTSKTAYINSPQNVMKKQLSILRETAEYPSHLKTDQIPGYIRNAASIFDCFKSQLSDFKENKQISDDEYKSFEAEYKIQEDYMLANMQTMISRLEETPDALKTLLNEINDASDQNEKSIYKTLKDKLKEKYTDDFMENLDEKCALAKEKDDNDTQGTLSSLHTSFSDKDKDELVIARDESKIKLQQKELEKESNNPANLMATYNKINNSFGTKVLGESTNTGEKIAQFEQNAQINPIKFGNLTLGCADNDSIFKKSSLFA